MYTEQVATNSAFVKEVDTQFKLSPTWDYENRSNRELIRRKSIRKNKIDRKNSTYDLDIDDDDYGSNLRIRPLSERK